MSNVKTRIAEQEVQIDERIQAMIARNSNAQAEVARQVLEFVNITMVNNRFEVLANPEHVKSEPFTVSPSETGKSSTHLSVIVVIGAEGLPLVTIDHENEPGKFTVLRLGGQLCNVSPEGRTAILADSDIRREINQAVADFSSRILPEQRPPAPETIDTAQGTFGICLDSGKIVVELLSDW